MPPPLLPDVPAPTAAAWTRQGWTLLALLLLAVALGSGWPLLFRLGANVQLDYNEGWNAARAALAARLQPLYGAPPGLAVTNYPPLSFALIGLLSHFSLDVVLVGRILSLAGLAFVCLAIRHAVRSFLPDGRAAWVAAALFFVWLEVLEPSRIAVDDPQLLGMGFEMAGFLLVLPPQPRPRAAIASAVFYALGVFTKQNLIALPLATAATLALGRQWRLLRWWTAAGLVFSLLLLALTEAVFGRYFFADLLCPRAYSVEEALRQSASYLVILLPVFVISGIWAWRNRNDPSRRLLALSWLFAHGLGFFFLGGDGTSGNILFEALVCEAIILPLALDAYLLRYYPRPGVRAGLVLALPVLFPLYFLPAKAEAAFAEWHALARSQRAFAAGVALLHHVSAPVVCENLLMCFRAGRTSAFDPFFALDQIRIGARDGGAIAALAASCRLGAVQFGDADVPEPASRVRFSPAFLAAVAKNYRPRLRTPEFQVLLPDPGRCPEAGKP